jgi:hypothetical protein
MSCYALTDSPRYTGSCHPVYLVLCACWVQRSNSSAPTWVRLDMGDRTSLPRWSVRISLPARLISHEAHAQAGVHSDLVLTRCCVDAAVRQRLGGSSSTGDRRHALMHATGELRRLRAAACSTSLQHNSRIVPTVLNTCAVAVCVLAQAS